MVFQLTENRLKQIKMAVRVVRTGPDSWGANVHNSQVRARSKVNRVDVPNRL